MIQAGDDGNRLKDVLLANSRLAQRLVSLSPHVTQLEVIAIASYWVRCRTSLEYGPPSRLSARGHRACVRARGHPLSGSQTDCARTTATLNGRGKHDAQSQVERVAWIEAALPGCQGSSMNRTRPTWAAAGACAALALGLTACGGVGAKGDQNGGTREPAVTSPTSAPTTERPMMPPPEPTEPASAAVYPVVDADGYTFDVTIPTVKVFDVQSDIAQAKPGNTILRFSVSVEYTTLNTTAGREAYTAGYHPGLVFPERSIMCSLTSQTISDRVLVPMQRGSGAYSTRTGNDVPACVIQLMTAAEKSPDDWPVRQGGSEQFSHTWTLEYEIPEADLSASKTELDSGPVTLFSSEFFNSDTYLVNGINDSTSKCSVQLESVVWAQHAIKGCKIPVVGASS